MRTVSKRVRLGSDELTDRLPIADYIDGAREAMRMPHSTVCPSLSVPKPTAGRLPIHEHVGGSWRC